MICDSGVKLASRAYMLIHVFPRDRSGGFLELVDSGSGADFDFGSDARRPNYQLQ